MSSPIALRQLWLRLWLRPLEWRRTRCGKPGRRWRRLILDRSLWLAVAGLAGTILANGGLLRLRLLRLQLQLRQCLWLRLHVRLRLYVRLQLRALRRGLLPQLWL